MALQKVCGIETEYGIMTRGFDASPVTASSVLINAYAGTMPQKVGWDFLDENPANDARGFSLEHAFAPEVESHLVNAVLTNGARYYVDHAHPEISTPECASARQVVIYDRAAEEIVRHSMAACRRLLPEGAEIVVYKNNSDGKGNSYGCHENYLVARETPFGRLASQVTTHFVTRQVFCGAGKVGQETDLDGTTVHYQLSQRADFFEEEVGLETTLKRPIVNTRDEPHCDPTKYRRLHVIVGDANMSEVATYLKVGTTGIILSMIEDNAFPKDLVIKDPVAQMRRVSRDESLKHTLETISGRRLNAIEVQRQLFEACEKYLANTDSDPIGGDAADVMKIWDDVLVGLQTDPESMADVVDWVAKRRIVRGYQERHLLRGDHPRLKAIDLQYHDMRESHCLAKRAGLKTMVSMDEVSNAISEPPTDTRAWFRGKCLQRWPEQIVAANWDSIVFDIGADPLRRVPMMEPLRGNEELTRDLFSQVSSAAELIEALGATDITAVYPEPGW